MFLTVFFKRYDTKLIKDAYLCCQPLFHEKTHLIMGWLLHWHRRYAFWSFWQVSSAVCNHVRLVAALVSIHQYNHVVESFGMMTSFYFVFSEDFTEDPYSTYESMMNQIIINWESYVFPLWAYVSGLDFWRTSTF